MTDYSTMPIQSDNTRSDSTQLSSVTEQWVSDSDSKPETESSNDDNQKSYFILTHRYRKKYILGDHLKQYYKYSKQGTNYLIKCDDKLFKVFPDYL